MPVNEKENATGICIFINKDLYRKFKIEVVRNGETIKGVITKFVKAYAGEDENVESESDSKIPEKE